jgi:SAM-dependent methyltransferase
LQLLDLLDGVDPAAGPLIDVGCGTGVGLAYLHAAVPGVRVYAIEPSKAMRTALHTRLTDDDALRLSTTVVPTSFGEARLPARACAVVVSAAFGHLSDSERRRLWAYVATQMPPGAPAVIGVLPPDRAISVPLVRYRELEVGDHVYEGWQAGEPVDDRTMSWSLVYKVRDGDEVIAEYTASSLWRCDGVDDVRAEIEPFGLTLTEHHDCVVVRARGRPSRSGDGSGDLRG